MDPQPAKRIRILIAATDPAYLYELVGRITSGQDMMVEGSVHTWRDAVRELARVKPDVALVELSMPGPPMVKQMKVARPLARIVILSGPGDEGPRLDDVIASGADGVIRKNATKARVLDCIRKVYQGVKCLPRGAGGAKPPKKSRSKFAA